MNNFSATGNLGDDPVTRFTNSGKAITSFRVAIKSGWGSNEATTWVNCVLWGRDDKPHGLAEYLFKGCRVGITGPITLREYTRKDGTQATSLDCTVRDLDILSPKEDRPAPSQDHTVPEMDSDDIPFFNPMRGLEHMV